jgi:hypothetical protein
VRKKPDRWRNDMDLGILATKLVPKSLRQALRESLRIVLQEELRAILEEDVRRINTRLTALEMEISEQGRLLRSGSDPGSEGGRETTGGRKPRKDVYATPKTIVDLGECYFYHTCDIPGYGHVEGEWDLRQHEHEYLGGVGFRGKRVLEVGTASGFLCFHMESLGAEVVAYDLSEDYSWDVVPFSRYDHRQMASDFKEHIRQLNNSFWLCRRAHHSNAKMVHGTVYDIPREIGLVDISVFSSVLLHVRDPFLALQSALQLTKETVIVAEPLPGDLTGPYQEFLPEFSTCEPKMTWWNLSPETIIRFVGVLGFEETQVKHHSQTFSAEGVQVPYYTVIGHRTQGIR